MKITKAQLSKLIKEELDQELKEQEQKEAPQEKEKSMGDLLTLKKALGRIDQTSEFGPAIERMLQAIENITDLAPALKAKVRQALIDTARDIVAGK